MPDAVLACHRCDAPQCVNEAHLFTGTTAENAYDSYRKGRAAAVWLVDATHCPEGHELTEANVKWRKGRRQCRTCVNRMNADWDRHRRAASRARSPLPICQGRHARTGRECPNVAHYLVAFTAAQGQRCTTLRCCWHTAPHFLPPSATGITVEARRHEFTRSQLRHAAD